MATFCAFMLVTFGGVAASPLDDVTGNGPMPKPLSSSPLLVVLVHLLIVVGQVTFVVFFYVFPSGHFVPRWTRWLALLALAYWLANVFVPKLFLGPQGNLLLVFWLVAGATQIYRYRRVSSAIEREQSKWIVFGFVLAFLIVGLPQLIHLLLPDLANAINPSRSIVAGLILSNTWVVAVLLIPVVIAIAVLRTHLWDIDAIINRALVYGLLTGLLAAICFGVVVGLEGLEGLIAAVNGKVSQEPVVVVVATLVIAALFTPLRRRLQTLIDRRFYRRKYDAAKTVELFAASLRNQTELVSLTEHLVGVVHETMQPTQISLWLPARELRSTRIAIPQTSAR